MASRQLCFPRIWRQFTVCSLHNTAFSLPKSHSPKKTPYMNLFPWKNEVELAKQLAENIVFVDRGLIAISKPWGLGMHAAKRTVFGGKSQAEAILASEVLGSSRFCLTDVLDYLAQILRVDQLHIVKSKCHNQVTEFFIVVFHPNHLAAHRDWSGLVLLSTSADVLPQVEKAARRAKAASIPHMRFYCITSGITAKSEDTERCGIRLIELDDHADYKEPIYVPPEQMSNNLRKAGLQRRDSMPPNRPVKPVTVHYRTLATNRDLAVSLVEVNTSSTKWSFVQCFLAYKASFVLGDTFFSRRVKHILGQPVVIQPKKAKSATDIRRCQLEDARFEPLSRIVQQALGVSRNAQLPLMIHFAGLTLPGLRRSLKSKKMESPVLIESNLQTDQSSTSADINITADQMNQLPPHFVYTLQSLNLFIKENGY